ncbi:hypothetical protein Tco_0878132 [Tanacetum coccineum]|uniref:MAK10-like protein n=1 Tax=Tanacetum coccineum TaxID=301880 RepID=A0ABQ5BZT3_9ASTR
MRDKNPPRNLGYYSRPSHKGYRNTIELPEGNNVVPLRSDTIQLVQNRCPFHRLRSEDPNQHLKDFLKLVDSLELNVENRERNTSDRRLVELENQVYYLMEAHLDPKQSVQVNKIASSCDICDGPHDTYICMKNPEQSFVDYASSLTDKAGGLVSNFMASQDARLSKFEAGFRQQQSKMTNKIDTLLKAINDQMKGALPSDTVNIQGEMPKKMKDPGLFTLPYMEKDPCPLLVGRGFLATASAVMDCKISKIAVGEGVTRSIFGVKKISLGHVDTPYWTTLAKQKFLALGWILEEIHVTWAHLEKKQTILRTYTKSHDDFCK